ncbi:hypothetical protein BKA93DRAFT_601024 [Sparassis latifolia]
MFAVLPMLAFCAHTVDQGVLLSGNRVHIQIQLFCVGSSHLHLERKKSSVGSDNCGAISPRTSWLQISTCRALFAVSASAYLHRTVFDDHLTLNSIKQLRPATGVQPCVARIVL